MKNIVILSIFFLAVLSGCGIETDNQDDGDFSLKIVKSGIKIEDMGYDSNLEQSGRVVGGEVYKFTIPIEVKGNVNRDIKVPVYYYFDGERNTSDIQNAVSNFANDGGELPYFLKKMVIKKGTEGIILLEGETDGELLQQNSSSSEYAWIAINYDDGFVPDNYAAVYNPYYDTQWDYRGMDNVYEKMRENEPCSVDGNVLIDEDSVKIKKMGNDNGVQHYKVSVNVKNDLENPVSSDAIYVGCDYSLGSPVFKNDCYDSLNACLDYMNGVSLGATTQKICIGHDDEYVKVEFDMFNRYGAHNKIELGSDLDYFFCYWISLCVDDDNRNDNYTIVTNPFRDINKKYEDLDGMIFDDVYTYSGAWNKYWMDIDN